LANIKGIMHRFALLPWVMKTGSFPLAGGAGRVGPVFCGGSGGGWRGGRCIVVLACRLSSLFTLGPFEAA
jgi:hypothetical protein